MDDAATCRWAEGACMKFTLFMQVAPTEGKGGNRSKRGDLLKQFTPGFSYTATSRVLLRSQVDGAI
jgi:hypothetical protein